MGRSWQHWVAMATKEGAMVFGMWMVRAEMWACTGFTWDPGASYISFFSLDQALNGIL